MAGPSGQQGGVVGAPRGGDEGLGQVRIARQVEMRRPPLDAGQQQVLDRVEADQASLHRVAYRGRHLPFREVFVQAQHLDVFALAGRPEARLKEAAQRVEGRIELPSPQRRRLITPSPIIGHNSFLTRRLENVRGEFSITALAYNIRRAISLVGVPALIAAARA